MTVVSNAGPLIALARIEQLDLLPALYGPVMIPPAVEREVFGGGAERKGLSTLRDAEWLQTKPVSGQTAVTLLRGRLDAGESETIVLALELEADVVLMDEARGRRIASSRDLSLTGTLGTLLLAKKRHRIAQVKPLVHDLAAEGFHMSDALYQHVLENAGER